MSRQVRSRVPSHVIGLAWASTSRTCAPSAPARARLIGLGTLALAAMFHAGMVSGATLRVPSEYPNLRAAIDATAAGDTVLVAPGTYSGPDNRDLRILRPIVVVSEAGWSYTVIDCDYVRRAIGVYAGGVETMIIDGFTFQRGLSGAGGAIALSLVGIGASATIRNCRFSLNRCPPGEKDPDCNGGAISCGGCVIEDCVFEGNLGTSGGAVYLRGGEIRRCDFLGNESGEGAVYLDSLGVSTVSDCRFIGNAAWHGAGIFAHAGMVTRCTFKQNQGWIYGGGVYGSLDLLADCVFDRNVNAARAGDPALGGALYLSQGSTVVRGCTFYANWSSGSSGSTGGAVYVGPGSVPRIENCIIAFSQSADAVACDPTAAPDIVCSDVYGNAGGDWVGCLAPFHAVTGNFSADPLFCDALASDFTLNASSPCLPGQHPGGSDCALIGAFGEGCADPTATVPTTWGALKIRFR